MPSFPTGLLGRVVAKLAGEGIAYTLEDKRTIEGVDPQYILQDKGGVLRLDEGPYCYQSEAVDAFLATGRGVIEVATGGGKTEIGAACIKSIGQQTLWLTHRLSLAYQTRKRLAIRLGEAVGLVGDGVYEPKRVTVGMVQTLGPLMKTFNDNSEFFRRTRFVIGDEVHHLESDQWFDLFDNLPAAYRLGLSATVPTGNSAMLLEAQTGPVLYRIGAAELIERGVLVPPRIWFATVKLPEKLYGKTFNEIYNLAVVFNKHRNELIRSIAVTLVRDRKPVLILVKRVAHAKGLAKLLKAADLRAEFVTSVVDQHVRDQYLQRLAAGDLDVIVAMDSIMGEGVDAPDLRAIINATGSKGGATKEDPTGRLTVQILGRGLRRAPADSALGAKQYCEYIDFVDVFDKDMRACSLARLDTLIEEGHGQRVGYWADYSQAA